MRIIIETLGQKRCFFHKWQLLSNNGFTKYSKCKKCHARKIEQPWYGFQTINFDPVEIISKVDKG